MYVTRHRVTYINELKKRVNSQGILVLRGPDVSLQTLASVGRALVTPQAQRFKIRGVYVSLLVQRSLGEQGNQGGEAAVSAYNRVGMETHPPLVAKGRSYNVAPFFPEAAALSSASALSPLVKGVCALVHDGLEFLTLEGIGLSGKQFETICEASVNSKLMSLCIAHTRLPDDSLARAVPFLAQAISLVRLSLVDCGIDGSLEGGASLLHLFIASHARRRLELCWHQTLRQQGTMQDVIAAPEDFFKLSPTLFSVARTHYAYFPPPSLTGPLQVSFACNPLLLRKRSSVSWLADALALDVFIQRLDLRRTGLTTDGAGDLIDALVASGHPSMQALMIDEDYRCCRPRCALVPADDAALLRFSATEGENQVAALASLCDSNEHRVSLWKALSKVTRPLLKLERENAKVRKQPLRDSGWTAEHAPPTPRRASVQEESPALDIADIVDFERAPVGPQPPDLLLNPVSRVSRPRTESTPRKPAELSRRPSPQQEPRRQPTPQPRPTRTVIRPATTSVRDRSASSRRLPELERALQTSERLISGQQPAAQTRTRTRPAPRSRTHAARASSTRKTPQPPKEDPVPQASQLPTPPPSSLYQTAQLMPLSPSVSREEVRRQANETFNVLDQANEQLYNCIMSLQRDLDSIGVSSTASATKVGRRLQLQQDQEERVLDDAWQDTELTRSTGISRCPAQWEPIRPQEPSRPHVERRQSESSLNASLAPPDLSMDMGPPPRDFSIDEELQAILTSMGVKQHVVRHRAYRMTGAPPTLSDDVRESLRFASESGTRIIILVEQSRSRLDLSVAQTILSESFSLRNLSKARVLWTAESFSQVQNSIDVRALDSCQIDAVPPRLLASRALGQTYQALVISDLGALRPNMLAQAMETVEGGGPIIVSAPPLTQSWADLYSETSASYRSCLFHQVNDSLFAERMRGFFQLSPCVIAVGPDGSLSRRPSPSPLVATAYPSASESQSSYASEASDTESAKYTAESAAESTEDSLSESSSGSPVLGITSSLPEAIARMCRGDESTALQRLLSGLEATERVSLTASRGRGKSAVLGLAAGLALHEGHFVVLAAPSLASVQTLLQFSRRALEALGETVSVTYEETAEEHKKTRNSSIRSITAVSYRHQGQLRTLSYSSPTEAAAALPFASLLIIDEAAAIPLPVVRSLVTRSPACWIASTVHGYEGTGRALSLKLFDELRHTGLQEVTLNVPIRYSPGCPVEDFLTRLLLLDADAETETVNVVAPTATELVLVHKPALAADEAMLASCYGVLLASHYRNSPDDLQLLLDCPSHLLWALIPRADIGQARPRVLCVIQTAIEGGVPAERVCGNDSKPRAGDVIPWQLAELFLSPQLAGALGLRVVRIAVPPLLLGMGYGSAALARLLSALSASTAPTQPVHWPSAGLSNEYPPLIPAESLSSPPFAWLGTSFGATLQLARFWSHAGLQQVHFRCEKNAVTGEYSSSWLVPIERQPGVPLAPVAPPMTTGDGRVHGVVPPSPELRTELLAALADARRRLVTLLGAPLRQLPSQLAAMLVVPPALLIGHTQQPTLPVLTAEQAALLFTPHDMARLGTITARTGSLAAVSDLFSRLAFVSLAFTIPGLELSAPSARALVGLAAQFKSPDEYGAEENMGAKQATALLAQAVVAITTQLEAIIGQSARAQVLSEEEQWRKVTVTSTGDAPKTVQIERIEVPVDTALEQHRKNSRHAAGRRDRPAKSRSGRK